MVVPPSAYVSSVWKDGIFADRVVFVTGGAGSICSAQTRAMVKLGANACIIGRNVAKTEGAAKEIAQVRPGAKVLGIGGVDVRNIESLQAAADRCVRELGAIDFVIAGAAGNFIAPISGLTPGGFKAVMDIDALGSYNTVKATIEHLCASASRNPNPSPDGRTGGRILFVSATFHYTGMPLQAHVSAAKAAVDALSASVAIEYGPRGVTSNVVAPGAIEGTEGMERLSVALAPDSRQSVRDVPSQRWGRVREIADATVFLFSDAGNYVNGAVLVVDGAGWRRHGSLGVGLDPGMTYPDFLLTEANSKIIKSGEKPRAATRTAAKL